ncbi:MAG TPA: DUF1036 domain-containing protein [Candidatus Dormibacteraeota bacterium]|nr:DUF1036 domain-containing protein [Candidatus Dormibacteraeota bacterium]
MKTVALSFVFFAVVCAASILHPATARASFRLCNNSEEQVNASIGYKDMGHPGHNWFSRGWWVIAPGNCATAIGGDVPVRYMYVYAYTAGNARVWAGQYTFCTVSDEFEIWGPENDPCTGSTLSHFIEVDTHGQTDWTYTFE